jgi:hypothetical protein
MEWSNKTVSPKTERPPKIYIKYPCPGLCRFAGMVCFLVVSLGTFYGGTVLLHLEPLDWAAPVWTAKHFGLVVAGILLGSLAGLLGFAGALTIEVRQECLNDFFIVLWQFLANGSMFWIMAIGIAMSVSMGREEAKMAIMRLGAERAFASIAATGGVVGLLMGIAFFLAPITRLPLIGYLASSATISLLAARWHFHTYAIEGKSWVLVGLIIPIFLLIFTPAMIERDRRQRRLATEQSE